MPRISVPVTLIIFLLLTSTAFAQEQVEKMNPLAAMRKVEDPDRGLTFYFDKTSPTETNKVAIYLFVGKFERRSPFIMMKIQDVGEDHLDIQRYEILVDSEIFKILPEKESDIKKGGQPPTKVYILDKEKPEEFELMKPMCFEYYERSIRTNQVKIIRRVIASEVASVVFIGKKGSRAHVITRAEKEAMGRMLDLFIYIGGDFDWIRD